jgi:hypothetical protein
VTLVVVSPPRTEHRDGCRFGSGYYRVLLSDGTRRFCQSQGEVEFVMGLLPHAYVRHVQRDGYCLDDEPLTDARTPDVVDAARWLALPQVDGMRELGLKSEGDYIRAYRMIEDAVLERDRAESHGGVHASIVIKRRGARVVDA